MLRYDKKDIKKILILKNDKIGDMVVSSGVFKEIKNIYPKSKITVIVSDSNKELIEKNPYIDKTLILNYPLTNFKEFKDFLKMALKLRKEYFDLGIDLRGSIYNIFFLLFLAGVKKRIGLYHRRFSRIFLHAGVKKERYVGKHCLYIRVELFEKALGIKLKNLWPDICYDKEDERILLDIIKKNKLRKYIIIIPDASYKLKQWSLEKWNELIKYLGNKHPHYKIIITGGDMYKINWLKKENPDSIIIRTNLRVLHLLFKRCSLVIAQDGGPMHLAWASRAKLIALMAEHMPIEYLKPLGENSRMVIGKMKNVPVEKVTKIVDELIYK